MMFPTPSQPAETQRSLRLLSIHLTLAALSVAAVCVSGYHPLAEDGGVYVAGVEYLLDTTLFPRYTAFVTAHLHYSVFAPGLAMLVHLTNIPLPWVLTLLYIFSLWLLLFAGLQTVRRCTVSPSTQLAAVSLLAAWSTLPIAGTSLLLTDPYLTARSFTTPLSLLAIAYALDDWRVTTSATFCGLCLAFAFLLHPLMALYALAMVVPLRLLRMRRSLLWNFALIVATVMTTAMVYTLAPSDSPSVTAASLSRYYWFLSQWQWYELCGLIGPFVILAILLRTQREAALHRLCWASLAAGSTAILVGLMFARVHSRTYLIARLQPMRVFLLIYAIMTLLLGAAVAEFLRRVMPAGRRPSARGPALLPFVGVMISAPALFVAQRATFPASRHIEAPWLEPINPWSQAFTWIRSNSPRDALFALDADYISLPGEDAQTFRATAQRSALPDFSKDGGEASISPWLTEQWQKALMAEFAVQYGSHLIAHHMLSSQSDAERDANLRPLGVTWVVLLSNARTSHVCPYRNEAVKVCYLLR